MVLGLYFVFQYNMVRSIFKIVKVEIQLANLVTYDSLC
jgi:hypothetical protein